MPTIHYAGALRIESKRYVTMIGAGYAACCSGDKAMKIRERGHNTKVVEAVTCKACLRRMAKASEARS